MDSKEKRPILTRGEEYIEVYDILSKSVGKDKRPTFDEARIKLKKEIDSTLANIRSIPKEYILDEVVINVKMDVNYSAKSYHPNSLINDIEAKDVGSKKWIKREEIVNKKEEKQVKTKLGKEIFLKIATDKLENFANRLESAKGFNKVQKDNIRSIDTLYFDNHSTLIEHFNEKWQKGKVEIVLHPLDDNMEEIRSRLIELIVKYGGNTKDLKYKTYSSGITFISVTLEKNILNKVLKFNPIRTAHPIEVCQLPIIRANRSNIPLPLPPLESTKSLIKLGVFDGGVNSTNPYFEKFVTEHNPINTIKNPMYVEHGSGVIGASLYNELSRYTSKDHLPTPKISVESFRVFPLSEDDDFDLYEAIDIIEEIVSKRKDIPVYNLSFGPCGAIEDDNISRFTYSLDELSKGGDVLFVVATGNEGNLSEESLCRIQAPSDAVNCIGVGAYYKDFDGNYERAEYSSYGDGREGCKVKPDFLDFGGSDNAPFQLISADGQTRSFSCGTSFAAPLTSAKAAEIVGRCDFANPLLARALLVHTSKHPNHKADKYMGHGIVNGSVEEILSCMNSSVTTISQSKLSPKKAIKLPITFIEDLDYNGDIVIEWTIALATEIDVRNSEDYTLSCIEDTFYPNSNKFTFYKYLENNKRTSRKVDITDKDLVEKLIKEGYRSSATPDTFSRFDNKYKSEEERKQNLKWDTIIKRRAKIKYKNLKDPYLVLHAMERFDSSTEFVHYAVVTTIDYIDFKGDVYNLTLKNYNKLEVAQIRAINDILVRV